MKKEVSCKTLLPLFNAANGKKLDYSILLSGVPYDLNYLLDKHQRIEWRVYCRIVENLSPYFSSSDFEAMGRKEIEESRYSEIITAGFVLFSTGRLARALGRQALRVGAQLFNCMEHDTEYIASNRIRITLKTARGYDPIPELFLITKGTWYQVGLLAKKGFRLNLALIDRGGVFDITWDEDGILFRLKRGLRWLLNVHNALRELNAANEALLEQYNELDESKRILEQQSVFLRTAHEITSSIRHGMGIESTLNAITDSMVTVAKFSYVKIRLYEGIEGDDLQIEASSGERKSGVRSRTQYINVDGKAIGELATESGASADISEEEELLNNLMRVISVSIHDSLVMRAVTDYRNNLEAKVEQRTSELKNAEDELAKTISLLKESQEMQNRFLTNISHEFRTPLTLILGPAERIIQETQKDAVRENARLIKRSAKKLSRLANQLLDLAKIEAGKMKLETSLQNIVPVLTEVVSTFESFAENKNMSLKFNCDQKEVMLYLDRDKFDKIMSNILSNAMKFTPRNGSVEVDLRLLENEVEISISDTGIGIRKNQMDKIFDRFYQVDNSLHSEFEGTGVGLSLTKELVELHKGRITVESEEGRGSTFKVTLPLGKSHLQPGEIIETGTAVRLSPFENSPKAADGETFVTAVMSRSKIRSIESVLGPPKPLLLIVEDNSYVRKYVAEIMNEQYVIAEASDGEDGMSKCFELMPDLVISDVMMPKMDGFQMCAMLKGDPRTCHIPIILLTAKATLQAKIEAFDTGADAYIMKPFDAAELKARIKNLLDQRKRLHEHFREFGIFEPDENSVASVDRKFLQKTTEAITKHIPDASFGVEELADELSVSKSLLHKKLVALVGEPPGELIKRFRLNKAAKLIEQNSGNMTDISFEVGFNNPSYFAACFKKQFAISPSRYHKP